MSPLLGIFAAFGAFLFWGFGEFSIQRATRRTSPSIALFAIGTFGFVVLFPFAARDFPLLRDRATLDLLTTTTAVTLLAALIAFEALRRGKISVIEPVLSFEVVATAFMTVALIHERLTLPQWLLIFLVFLGVLLTVLQTRARHWWEGFRKRSRFEQGALLAAIGSVVVAAMNVLTGLASQRTSPFLTMWFVHTGLMLILLASFLLRGTLHNTFTAMRDHWRPLLAESVFDNGAWIFYGFAVTALPIAITIAITEGYVALAAVLGLLLNKEKLQRHQFVGILLTLAAVCALASMES